MGMDIHDKIRTDYYKTKLPFVRRDKNPDAWEAYRTDQNRLDAKFKRDALESVGLTDHPKAEKAWAFAWEEGHSNGDHDVLHYLEEIAEVIKD